MNTVIAVMASLGGVSFVGTAITMLAQRRMVRAQVAKTGADAAAVLAETATELLEPLREELRETRVELGDTRRELSALRRHLGRVEDILRMNGIPAPEFIWPPTVKR